jgi:hypothetical protein
MKLLKIFLLVVASIVVFAYVVVFTPFGNSLLKPVIEAKLKESTNIDIKLQRFLLSFSDFDVAIYVTPNNLVELKGEYSIFSKSFDIDYDIKFLSLKELRDLAKQPIDGEFKTDGKVKGDVNFIQIDGFSDVAQSKTSYHVELTKLNPTSIIAKIEDLKLESLLHMAGQKQYATSQVDIYIIFKNIHPHNLDGDVKLITKNGEFNSKVLKKDFNITVPKTTFRMRLNAILKGDDIDYNYIFDSNLAKLASKGRVSPNPLELDISYSAKCLHFR